MLDYLFNMSLYELQNMAAYFNLIGFKNFSKDRLIEFLISKVDARALQHYIAPLIREDEHFGKRIETELMQQEIEDQFNQMGLNSIFKQPSSTGYSRPVGTIRVSTQTLNSLLNGMNIGGVQANKQTFKFRTGKSGQIKRLQK